MTAPDGVGSILFVCTANICRSPYAHLRCADELARVGVVDIAVSSAGVSAIPGHAVATEMVDILRDRDVDGSGWRSRRLSSPDVLGADLILTATREHRAAVVRSAPAALKRTFTLLQFQRLLATAEIDDPTAASGTEAVSKLVEAANAARGRSVPGEDDLADPWQRPHREYVAAAELTESALVDLVAGLRRIRRR